MTLSHAFGVLETDPPESSSDFSSSSASNEPLLVRLRCFGDKLSNETSWQGNSFLGSVSVINFLEKSVAISP